MWKYLGALMLLLTIGVVSAQPPVCTDCYANIITQTDSQIIDTVKVGMADTELDLEDTKAVCIGNEGLSAAIIVTPAYNSTDPNFLRAGFSRIDQVMSQTIYNLGTATPELGEEGAKGIVWNKAIQGAWIADQGAKELELDENGELVYVKEGAYIGQTTTQTTSNVYDFDSREDTKILNLDNKLAMIVDDLETVINITASAESESSDSQSSYGNITNDVDGSVTFVDPEP